ncbi:hypothetical protein BCR34DRAFT_474270 [Clohesyomyces aquaticus]|uniref:Uncharacterized protein n=1 Tax=Clohesyomyces aquaticus TaxID=1231657 RepID=A0A1Y2A5I2_9PLEO|nr:hypothetical protein BCR34DRAFT_474270 [Clohesyomyces aquaticus]
MGRTTTTTSAPEAYRDDPDAVSMHTTPDDYNYDDAPEITGLPPSYTDSESAILPPMPIHHIQPPPTVIDHNKGFEMSGGKVIVGNTQTIMDARYDNDPQYLEDGIRQFAHERPIPYAYIMGTHRETVRRGDKKETKTVTDFRVVISMQSCLWTNFNAADTRSLNLQTVENGEKAFRGTFMKKRAPGYKRDLEVGNPKPELKEWCHLYCASPARLRIFRLSREITGFDETFLKGRLEGLIRSTNYRGHIDVQFPVAHKDVDIYTTNRINEWRLKKWVCWIFYLTFLWIFTWPYLFFATKRYSVVKAQWPFSTTDANGNKKYTTISEEQWFEKWHVGIKRLVLDRFQGETDEQALLGVIARPEDPPMPGTVRTGHAGVDNAVGLLSQGFQVASALTRGGVGNLANGLQGGWGYDT